MSRKKEELTAEELEQYSAKLLTYFNRLKDSGIFSTFSQLFQTDYRILIYLYDKKDAHPSVIADELKVTRPNIAANLRLLESKNYIERVIDVNNRRQVYVNITDEGRYFCSVCRTQLSYLFAGWFSLLGKEETEHLFKILETTTDSSNLDSNLKNFNFGE